MLFVWDESKRLKVLKDHKVDFRLLTDVFDDPFGIYGEDVEHSNHELRYSVVGRSAEYGLVFVIFIYVEDKVRLITARRAEGWMKNEYERR